MDIDYTKFERYTRDVSRIVDKITLTTSRQIGFPQAFARKHMVHDFEGIILYWEPISKSIAVEFTNDISQKGFTRIVKSEKYGAYAGISTFLSTHSLNPRNYQRRYDYQKIDPTLIGAPEGSSVFVFKLIESIKEVQNEEMQ